MRQILFGGLVWVAFAAAALSVPVPTGAQSAPTPSSAPAGPSSAGASAQSTSSGSGGSSYIESTILEYQGLQLSADAIAQAIKHRIGSSSEQKIVVATPADVTAILQLRIVLSQIEVYVARLTVLKAVVDNLKVRTNSKPVAHSATCGHSRTDCKSHGGSASGARCCSFLARFGAHHSRKFHCNNRDDNVAVRDLFRYDTD